MSLLLATGPGILLLTIVASASVAGAVWLAAILTLALVVGAIRVLGRLRRW